MNRATLRAGIRCLIYIFAAMLIISLAAPAYSAEGGKAIAKLTSFSGTVLIKSQGSWGVEPAKGLSFYSDDKIVTKTGIATITFDDGAVVEVKANSNFLIRETETGGVSGQVGAVKRQLRLIIGKVLFRSGRGTSVNTQLETTTMVCGLRGTAGTLSIDASGVTYLQFTEGGGDTVGNFIAGIAPDVPAEVADLNEAQRAAWVANLAAEQAKEAAEKLKSGQATDPEAQLAASVAAMRAAQEAKAAAEAMLNNPDESIREEARKATKKAEKAIKEARKAIQAFLDGGYDLEVLEGYYGALGDRLRRLSNTLTAQGNEWDLINYWQFEEPEPPEPPEPTYNYIGGFNAEIIAATTCHSGYYEYDAGDFSSHYEYSFSEDGSEGESIFYWNGGEWDETANGGEGGWVDRTYYITTTYYPDGTTRIFKDCYTGCIDEESTGTWDRNTFDVSTVGTLPDEYFEKWGNSEENYTFTEYLDETTMGTSGLALTGELSVAGSMWGAEAQADGVPLEAEGTITAYEADASIWSANVYSENDDDTTATTYDGGAYYGYFGGIKNNTILEATLAALGVAPDGTAGLLRAGDYLNPVSGEIAGNNTFRMDGEIVWDPKGSIPGVTAENLLDYIYTSDEGFMGFGVAAGGATITGLLGYGGYGGYDSNFETANITTSEVSAPWGIYKGYNYGEYDTSSTATSYTGHIGGYGGFGAILDQAYYNEMGEYPEDMGYFIGDTTVSWTGGKIAGGVDGRFITYTKMGDLDGDIQGTYDQTSGLWEAGTRGTWEGEDLKFVSAINYYTSLESTVRYHQATYNAVEGGGYYYYYYYDDNTYGYSYWRETGATYPQSATYYYPDGTTVTEYHYSSTETETTYGTWDPGSQDLADIVTVLPDGAWPETPTSSNEWFAEAGAIQGGILGGTESLWGGSAPVTVMGSYYDDGLNRSGIWSSSLNSYNYLDYTNTTYDSGAYYGFIGGTALENGSSADDLEARLIALYIDPDGNAGILKGALTGFGYEDTPMFELDGTITPVQLQEGIGIAPSELVYSLSSTSTTLIEGGSGYFPYGYIEFDAMNAGEYWITGAADWGISILTGEGTYTGTTSDDWTSSLESDNGDSIRTEWREITGMQWSAGKLAGDIAGAWINIDDATTGVSGGELTGIFDANNSYWRSFGTEAWMETTKFLDMAHNNPDALDDLNIPCVQVGVTDLSYSDSEMTLASIDMNDVEFFAYSDGSAPKIWATGDVQGVTRADPVGESAVLMNSDESVSVSFYVNNCNNAAGGTWSASIDGSGTVSGHAITMEGGAAGTVDTEYIVGATNGAFSGTAAGVSREDE